MIGGIKVGRRTWVRERPSEYVTDLRERFCDEDFEFHLTLIQAQAQSVIAGVEWV